MTLRTQAGDTKDFSEILLMSVEQGVASLLGEQVVQSLFFNMENHQGLRKDEIPHRLDVFFPALEKAFGPTSGKTIGRFIIKSLYAKLGMEFVNRPNYGLPEYVKDARRELGLEK